MESGTDATQDLSFFSSTSGTVASATDQFYTGSRSLKITTTSGSTSTVLKGGILNDTGRRISLRFRFNALPAEDSSNFLHLRQADGTTAVARLSVNLNGTLRITPVGATDVNGTAVLAAATWYRIVLAYTITNTTTFRFKVFVGGVSDIDTTAGTLTNTATDSLQLRCDDQWSITSNNIWFDDIYIDDGSDYSDPGDIRVTNKRAFANGTTNGFTTQIGAGGSGYGSGHAPQVNEQPLSVTNGWSHVVVSSAITEEYNVEGLGVGDIPIPSVVIDLMGWLYAKALIAETAQIVLNGVNSSISLTSTNTLFTKAAGSTASPAETGTDIGIITATTATTVSLYECGILVAYLSSIVPVLIRQYRERWTS